MSIDLKYRTKYKYIVLYYNLVPNVYEYINTIYFLLACFK